jgi:uncharacterized integral membrane protein (TIGR00698 family)
MRMKSKLPGLLVMAVVGLTAYFTAPFIPMVNGVMLGLLLGIILGNVVKIPSNLTSGVSFSGSTVLESAIVLMAFGISFSHFSQLGWSNLILVIAMILALLLFTAFMAKKMKCPDSTGHLVGFGTAICGSSAIAAVAPGISKQAGDVAIALAVVNLMGSLGMVVYPFLMTPLGLDEIDAGVFIGATLHSVGNVAGAGYGMEKEIGDVAISIKMARVAMLTPAVIFFTFLVNRNSGKSWKENAKLPHYLWIFVGVTLLVSFVSLPSTFLNAVDVLAKILLTVAMVAIGTKVSFVNLYRSGRKALTYGFIVFGFQIAFVVLWLVIL